MNAERMRKHILGAADLLGSVLHLPIIPPITLTLSYGFGSHSLRPSALVVLFNKVLVVQAASDSDYFCVGTCF